MVAIEAAAVRAQSAGLLTAPKVIASAAGRDWTLYNGDCCEVLTGLPADSIDLCIHSPPFADLFVYSDSMADMGNCASREEFFRHYRFAIQELHRVTVPGRLCAVHCKDLQRLVYKEGVSGLYDFPGDIIREFEAAGWTFHSRVTIWKDPVIEMQRTKAIGLLHKQVCKDSTSSRQGMADYLLVFRKWDGLTGSDFTKPVHGENEKARFTSYCGIQGPGEAMVADGGDDRMDRPSCRPASEVDYSIQVWQRYASPVWFDIQQTRVLNYQEAKAEDDERHICPLALDVIDRCLHLWSNPGDVVLSPFAGIGSEGHQAILAGRKFVGIELKESYFKIAAKMLKKAEAEAGQKTLF